MRKCSLAVRIAMLLSLLALTAACGGGGGGGAPAAPAKGTFTKEPFKSSTVGWGGVFNNNGLDTFRVQNLYTGTTGSNQITGSGYIAKIAFKADGAVASAFTCTGVTVKMGHTGLALLTATFANNVEQGKGSLVTVVQDKTVTIPVLSAGDYISIDLTTPFYYNGVDNLVVDYIRTGTCTGTVDFMYDDTGIDGQAVVNPDIVSPTGDPDLPINMKFTFAGGENKQEYGGTDDNIWPFSSNGAPTVGAPLRTQNLYLASKIKGSGPVMGIGFQMNATSVEGTYTYSLTLGHSTLSALTTTFASNYSDSPVTVASAVTFTIPAGIPAGEWIWVPIPGGVFTYNGVDNLIVSVATTSGTADNHLRTTTIAGSHVWGDSATAATGTVDDSEYNIALRFKGGPIAAGIGAASSSSGQVFEGDGDGAEIQSLYHATELGTGGSIASIGLRLLSDSVAATHNNYTVKIGHTAKTTLILTDTYASNMNEDLTVHSGSFNIPAGLKAGDWITIPLSSAFTYDPTKNLSVLFSTGGGAGVNNSVRWKSSATQFPGRVVGGEAGGAAVPEWTDDGILEIRLNMRD